MIKVKSGVMMLAMLFALAFVFASCGGGQSESEGEEMAMGEMEEEMQAPPQGSPAAETSVSVNGSSISIDYHSPAVRGRDIFSEDGLISGDGTYPVWRAGANDATAFHTDTDLTIGDLSIPAGDYTLFVEISDPDNWQFIVNEQTGQWGLEYNADQDLGRVPMEMSTPPSLVESLEWELSDNGDGTVDITLTWENHIGSVTATVN